MEQDILNYAESMDCSELHMLIDKDKEFKGIIAIHNTLLGPALGGCRCIEYPSSMSAIIDAIRLAQGMTYKSAIFNLPLGGGKMVLIKPKEIKDRSAYFKVAGRFVESLRGRYITAEDSGTSVEDMDIIATETEHVTGTSKGTFTIADPSLLTAQGVEQGIMAAVSYKLGKASLEGVRIAIQGLGHVGYHLAKRLHQRGAEITVLDVSYRAVERVVKDCNAKVVQTLDELLQLDCDVFAPCALGAILNDRTIDLLKAHIVAGSANNQLEATRHGEKLMQKGILYAPDYVINAGGLIYVAAQYSRINEDTAKVKIDDIYRIVTEIFKRSAQEKKPTNEIADLMAMERLKLEPRKR